MTDSSTGGYLLPKNTALEDRALIMFLQECIAGVTGLPGNLVRPRWQPNPPNQPRIDVDWAAIGITKRKTSTYLYEIHDPLTNQDITTRNEDLTLLCSFYGFNAENNASLVRDGFGVGQNREALQLAGMAFIDTGDITNASSVINDQWYARMDITINMRRSLTRFYQIYHLLSAGIDMQTDISYTNTFINVPKHLPHYLLGNGDGFLLKNDGFRIVI